MDLLSYQPPASHALYLVEVICAVQVVENGLQVLEPVVLLEAAPADGALPISTVAGHAPGFAADQVTQRTCSLKRC